MAFFANIFKKLGRLFERRSHNAALHWESEGGAALHQYWLYATPVHMELGRDSYFLTEANLNLSAEQSQALLMTLNDHFSEEGYTFHVSNDVWFVGLDRNPNVTTTPIEAVVNKDVAAFLPKGEGALDWANVQNEIQMLLFNHPINTARVAQGLPEINSIWFYGEGRPNVLPINT